VDPSAVYQQLNMMHRWTDISMLVAARHTSLSDVGAARSDTHLLHVIVITAGICWSILFVAVGLGYELQLYGDGSIFSYSVAAEDAWAFHWHNIPGRLFVYLFSYVPAETYVDITGDPRGGIVIYGLLFFVAPLLGLMATWLADYSKGRIILGYACGSTACLCPLSFGFPTEVWMAHALFWPALALCHYAPRGMGGAIAVFMVLLALVFTHEGALIFVVGILATLLLRGREDATFMRAGSAFLVVITIWALVKAIFPPDVYFATAFDRAALHVFDFSIFTCDMAQLLFAVLATYAIALYILWRLSRINAATYAVSIVVVALAVHWFWFDHALHADNRYYMRTVVLIVTPMLGALGASYAIRAEGCLAAGTPILLRLLSVLESGAMARATVGALLLVLLVHAVETTKFVAAWTHYKDAVRALAEGVESDPGLGDRHFVSSARIAADLNRLSWSSTTHFLSVLLTPNFAPSRLVLDATANYFWLACETAAHNELEYRSLPVESRRLVRVHACLHR
jgi:hypothetical protein